MFERYSEADRKKGQKSCALQMALWNKVTR